MELTNKQEDLILEEGRERDYEDKILIPNRKCSICEQPITNDTQEFYLDDVLVCEGCYEAEKMEAENE